ncbi:hypothetical protein F3Y22_tig00111358pilonHSYRG00028 [Hibiscus syriacus]|uniref:Retrotransposon gag domain-containing protein n=1 Tax=Hibiscus syriacus TaxID=106335 RepID=A0A6A2YNM8_HIBSY|nr:hypothetical protein F3Y22_tig00111358pilonHSYRG00028 [Hibiscus syriacus]
MTSKTHVQSKTKGDSHSDAIPISYKELYEKLLEAREVAPYYIKPFQPVYPNWHDINVYCEYHAGAQGHTIENCLAFKRRVQSLLDHGTLQFVINYRPNLVTEGPARLIPKMVKEDEGKNNIMKKAAAQANNMAHKLVDLAGLTRELRQIDNSTPEHEWKLIWLLREIEKLGVKVIPYMKEASDLVPDGSNQIIQWMKSVKEKINDKEQPCCQIEESRMITYPGTSHSNPRNSLVNYSQYEERFKRMDEAIRNMESVNASHKELESRELSLVPDLVIPHEFKMPNFEKYNDTSCPLIHLKMFYRKMEGYLSSDDLLIHSFHDSLSGPTVIWYNQLTQEQIKRWVDLADVFLKQYRYVKVLAPTRMNLQGVKNKANERFQEYALRWRGVAAQVQPPMLEKEISCMFRDSLPAPFFELMQANPTEKFENLMISGELIENVISEENSKVTSKSQTNQKAKADNVNECRIQSPRNCKRKRASSCSDRPKKVMQSRKTLEVFQTSILDLYPHLVKGQYITPRSAKVPPNPSAHCYDQNSFFNFHLGVYGHSTGNCRPLLKEIETLVDK